MTEPGGLNQEDAERTETKREKPDFLYASVPLCRNPFYKLFFPLN